MNSAQLLGDSLKTIIDVHLPQSGIISLRWDAMDGLMIHVGEEYFDAHYGDMARLVEPLGKTTTGRLSVKTSEGATIFCLKNNMYTVEMSRA